MRKDILNNPIVAEDMRKIYEGVAGTAKLEHSVFYVTGATGMIGSYITAFLIWLNEEKGLDLEIYILARSARKVRGLFGEYGGRDYFHILENDINDRVPDNIRPDFVFHGASPASPQYYGSNPVETMLPNLIGTYRILERLREVDAKGMVYLSSGAVYGSVESGRVMTEDRCGFMDFLAPGNVYGESKRCAEALCHAYAKEYGIRVMSARINHTYGPTMDVKNDSRVFSEFVSNVLENRNIVIKGTGRDRRFFTYITDTVSALFRILLLGNAGESYNIANNDCCISVGELARMLTEMFPEKNLKTEHAVRHQAGYAASPEKELTSLSIEKISCIGWKPVIGIREGFTRTVRSFEVSP